MKIASDRAAVTIRTTTTRFQRPLTSDVTHGNFDGSRWGSRHHPQLRAVLDRHSHAALEEPAVGIEPTTYRLQVTDSSSRLVLARSALFAWL